jgi:long-chain acyl-CoA synthetase
MPGVEDVAVVGLPGGRLGEDVVAAIVLKKGHPAPDLKAVREWCSAKMAKYALPGRVVILPDLPRSQIGKVLRRIVRADILASGAAA